jgi:ABC-type amino acid transport system permease subunit
MTEPRRRFRAAYGAGPLHLLALVAGFAIATAGVLGWFQRPRDVGSVVVWFAAAIVIHDVVLLPLYSLLDRIVLALHRRVPRPRGFPHGLNAAPYMRIPAMLSGLLLVVFFPVIFGLGAHTELAASGIPERGYLARWLLATGVMFALSGGAYAVAVARARARAIHDRKGRADRAEHSDRGGGGTT